MFHLNACMDTQLRERLSPVSAREKSNSTTNSFSYRATKQQGKETELNLLHDFYKHRAK